MGEPTSNEWYLREDDGTLFRDIRFALRPGVRGRVLSRPFPDAKPPLLTGDRLEPFGKLMDTYLFERLVLPCLILFWRESDEVTTHHRHPLIGTELGVGLHNFSIDVLHTLHLGIYHAWLNYVIWVFIFADIFDTGISVKERHTDVTSVVCKF